MCKYRSHPLFLYKARLIIVNCKEQEEDKWVISTPKGDIVHTCKPNEPKFDINIEPLNKYEKLERPEWYKDICHACCHRFNMSSKVAKIVNISFMSKCLVQAHGTIYLVIYFVKYANPQKQLHPLAQRKIHMIMSKVEYIFNACIVSSRLEPSLVYIDIYLENIV